jgi:phage terminase large subunit-like protein
MRFDLAAARHAIEFFGFLRHSKGEWAGLTFELAPWQAFIVGALFGWKRNDGLRRFRTAYCAVAPQERQELDRGRDRVDTLINNLHVAPTNSRFMPLSSDSSTMHGLNLHGAIIDELHAHKTRNVVDVLETATGARRQPLLFEITTAGYDRHSSASSITTTASRCSKASCATMPGLP